MYFFIIGFISFVSYNGWHSFTSKIVRVPRIAWSDDRGQDLRSNPCLVRVFISQFRSLKRFGLNFYKILVRVSAVTRHLGVPLGTGSRLGTGFWQYTRIFSAYCSNKFVNNNKNNWLTSECNSVCWQKVGSINTVQQNRAVSILPG